MVSINGRCIGGNLSGASQPHKHLQFIPVAPGDEGPPIERVAKSQAIEAHGGSHLLLR